MPRSKTVKDAIAASLDESLTKAIERSPRPVTLERVHEFIRRNQYTDKARNDIAGNPDLADYVVERASR
ncbi:MAG: hypothetical protein ACR2RL_25095 [Gammaproteobacteria bacterium]